MEELSVGAQAELAIKLIVYLIGVLGNLLVIFVIVYLKEYKKITHWYVLQLAIADLVFLQSIPFKISEIIHKAWTLPIWLCKAKQSILYINYYGSIIFLTLMAIDRYLAVCHGLSKVSQKLRSTKTCYAITTIAWIVAILMCIPVMMYADISGNDPTCVCTIAFPRNKRLWCDRHYIGYDTYNVTKCLTEEFGEQIGHENCKPQEKEEEENAEGSGNGSGFDYSDYIFGPSEIVDNETDGSESSSGPDLVTCVINDENMGEDVFIYFNFVVMFIIPLIIISVSYALIIIRLRKTDTRSRRSSEPNESSISTSESTRKSSTVTSNAKRRKSSSGGRRQKTKVTIMCAVLVLLFATCWLPYHVVKLAKLKGLGKIPRALCSGLEIVTLILIYINSALNPYLYNFLGTFGKRLRQIRKHKRTKSLMASFRMSRMGRRTSSFVSSSESAKTRRTTVPNERKIVQYLPKEEVPLTILNDYEGATTSSNRQL